MKKIIRGAGVLGGAWLIAMTLGMDLAVVRPARPEAIDLFGYVYQLIARTFASLTLDSLSTAALFAVAFWFCKRYLFHKPVRTGLGEYLLSFFFGGMMLLNTAVRTQDTIAVLWANWFQLAKALMCFVGFSLMFLMLIRALREGLSWLEKTPACETLKRLDERQKFWTSFAVISLAWLVHIIARYPGVLMWDSYMQIKQFMGEAERWTNHPPFGTLLYGLLAAAGEMIGNRNLMYFIFTLVQCAACITVLAYSLQVMKNLRVPAWVRLAALIIYALSPCYVGWLTVIAKDSSYLLFYLLLIVLMTECLFDRKHFFGCRWKSILTGIAMMFLALCRHNGMAIACVIAVSMVLVNFSKERKKVVLLACICTVCLVLFSAAETAIQDAQHIKERYIPDVMSMPFQQTARVVKFHPGEMPPEEEVVLDKVLDYPNLALNYDDDYADAVKDSYRQSASAEDRRAYWKVWLAQLKRYPVEYVDAMLHMNGVLFDLRINEPMYICFSDMALNEYVYPWSFNDMSMYDREALVPLNSINRTLTEMYMDFDKWPVVGMLGSMSFHSLLMCAMLYISWISKHRKSMLVWIPGFITFGICLFSPVVYLRYALPYVCAMPMGMAGYFAKQKEE